MDEILSATGLSFAQYGWTKAPPGDYGVWADDGANDLVCDDRHRERVTTGTVDYFTRDPSPTVRATIENALQGKVAWELDGIDFESDTGYIHYTWRYERG